MQVQQNEGYTILYAPYFRNEGYEFAEIYLVCQQD